MEFPPWGTWEERGKGRGGLTEMEVGEKGNRGEDRKLGSEPEAGLRTGCERESIKVGAAK